MTPSPAPEHQQWRPSGGILTRDEVGRALASRPGWRRRNGGLVRRLQLRDYAAARDFTDRLAEEATYYGRHPDIEIHDDGRVVLSLVGPNHVGVTLADLAIADKVDRAVEQHG